MTNAITKPPGLYSAAVAIRVTIIGVVLLAGMGSFAYLRGWLTPAA